ncbi:MAG: RsmE family RNA methyltransferase [Anaerovoracaceae bacterium]|nr:RsmE family RNA methyltransferase [Bacillota bacterium]MDY5770657.1 RsmE family RNA methyltransferase [Anaerovoracaceae bacterium]
MSKFFVDPSAVMGAHIYMENREDLHHLGKVLRGRPGMEIDISDGDCWEYKTVLEELTEDCATLKIIDKQKFATEPVTRVTLYQGIPKAAKMETVIQKTVEMGVDTIVPVFMERTVVVEKGNFGKKLDRWQKISAEAVKQCKRGIIPRVTESYDFDRMLAELADYDMVICPYENEEGLTIKDYLRGVPAAGKSGRDVPPDGPAAGQEGEKSAQASSCPAPQARRIGLIIGPEGGFSDGEVARLKAAGAATVTLGKTILRTETAGLAALAMIMYELEL